MTTPTKYTDAQIKFISDARIKRALEWEQLAREFGRKYGGTRTGEQMRHAFRLHVGDAVVETSDDHPLAEFTHDAFGEARRVFGGARGRFFVTAASPVSALSRTKRELGEKLGRNLFEPGWQAVQTWLAEMKGELVLLPMRAHMPALHGQPSHYDSRLLSFRKNFASEYRFNEHLRALDVHLNPQQLAPLTGMYRIRGGRAAISVAGKRVPTRFNQSLIFAHAKQDMEPIPTGNNTTPRLLHTTGAITLPEYLPNRIGTIAADTHILGGLIVEIDGDKFWIRQVQFAADGSFCDLGMRYYPGGRTAEVCAVALRPGDVHGGHEAEDVLAAQARLSKQIEPTEVFVEDVFDGSSISHHTERRRVTRAKRKFRTLADELNYDRALFERLARLGEKLLVVSSNHHDHLTRYLEEGRYLYDENHELGHRMVVDLHDGRDPLRMRLDPDGKYVWLGTDEDYLVEGVQMAGHGHIGIDGARGSAVQLEKAYGAGMSGHTHVPGIRGRMYTVGHSSEKRHGYNTGISRWLNTCGLVWPGGQMQLVTIIDGRYCLDDSPHAGGKVRSPDYVPAAVGSKKKVK